SVKLRGRFRRGLRAEFLHRFVERLRPRLLILLCIHRVVAAARAAFIDDTFAPQRNDRNEENDEEEPRVVRLKRGLTMAMLTARAAHAYIRLAHITRADAIDRHWHDAPRLRERLANRRWELPRDYRTLELNIGTVE